jgi:hypothetical protein
MQLGIIGAACLLLAACGGGAKDWARPGSDDAAAQAAYDDCRDRAAAAVRTDTNIDQDIAATRSPDLQRSALLRAQSQDTTRTNRDRGETIIAACMSAKGFGPAPAK